jgi:hypothetical protein
MPFDVCEGVWLGDKDGETVVVCETVGTLWCGPDEVVAGEVGVGVIVVEEDLDGSEDAECATVKEVVVVCTCVTAVVGNCLRMVWFAVTTTDAVGVKEGVRDTVCDLLLLEYGDDVGVCVLVLDGVEVPVVVGVIEGLSDGENVGVSLCVEATTVNSWVAL